MKRFFITSLAMGSLLTGTQVVYAGTINFDTFDSVNNLPNVSLLVDPNLITSFSSEMGLPLAQTMGSNRRIDLTYTSVDPLGDSEVELIPLPGSGTFAVTNGSGLPLPGFGGNSETIITWNPNRHLRDYITNGMFEFEVMGINFGADVTLRLDVSDGVNTSFSQITLDDSNAFSLVSLPFTGFNNPTIFDNVLSSVALTIFGDPEHGITLDSVRVSGDPQANAVGTPEPPLLLELLVTVGIVGAQSWSSRRKRHQ